MSYSSKRELILEGKMKKVILTLALPIMFNNFIQTLYNLVDAFWVSKLGAIEFAATAFVWPVLFLIISLGVGMNVAGTALISQHIGANDKKNANVVAGQLFTISIIITLVFSAIGFFTTDKIVYLMGARGQLLNFSTQYLRIMFLDVPVLFVGFVFAAIRQGQGDTITPMIINVCSVVLNMILDPIFIFTLGMGIRGAAIATVLSKLIFAIYIIYFLLTKKEGVHIIPKYLRLKREILYKIIRVGLPASLGQAGAALGFIVLNSFVVSFGDYTLAAFGIGNRINSLVMMPAMGIGSALATVVGQNLGADKPDRAKQAFKTSVLMSITYMSIGGVILIFFAENVIGIFAKEREVIEQGTYYMRLIAASLPLMGIFQSLLGAFQGSGHTMYMMYLNMGRLWIIRIPMIILFKNYTLLGSKSVWFAMIISNFIICGVGLILYIKGNWQRKIVRNV